MNKRYQKPNKKSAAPMRPDVLVLIILAIFVSVLLLGVVVSSKIASAPPAPVPASSTTTAAVNVEQTTTPSAVITTDAAAESTTGDVEPTNTESSATYTQTAATPLTTSKQASDTTAPATEYTKKQGFVPDKLGSLNLNSDYFIGFDKTYNKVIYEKNADARCYPASVTKVLTALVALENLPIDAKITVGTEIKIIARDSSVAGVKQGQEFTLEGILYGLMLPSGNDVAYTVAVNTARYLKGRDLDDEAAVKYFMELCNNTAKRLGANNTHFSCPDGYHHDDHYTTVRDILKISIYAMENKTFAAIVGSTYKKVKALTGETYEWYNTNYMLNGGNQYYYKYTTGIKTGLTDQALYCLSASAEKDGREIYAVAFHATSASKRNGDVKKFFEAAFAQLK